VLLEVKGAKRALCSILYVLLLTAFYHACMGLACIEGDITADSNENISRGVPKARDVQVSLSLIRQQHSSDIAYMLICPHGAGRERREEWCRLSAQARKGAEACCSSARLRLEISLALKSPEIDDPQG
jgi:hypothetical protein